MKKHLFLPLLLVVALLSGCSAPDANSPPPLQTGSSAGEPSPSTPSQTTQVMDPTQLFSDRDYIVSYDEAACAQIRLDGETASCSSDAVRIEGGTVTILDEGTYVLSGTLSNGMIIVNAQKTDKVQLVLSDASIHSETSAAIYVLQADKVFLTSAPGTSNTLSNGGTFTAIDENNIDAVIFSKDDLTLNGEGSLTVTSPAGHGIVSKDSLTITGGTYDIGSASHGLAGKDDVCIAGGSFTITSGKDGIHAENADDATSGFICILGGTYQISAEGDGISAAAALQIENGTFDILAGGGSVNGTAHSSSSWGDFMGGGGRPGGGMGPGGGRGPGGNNAPGGNNGTSSDSTTDSTSIKGIKASADLVINGGSFTIDSADDSIHSNSSVSVCGGTFHIASGDDAFHADDTLRITSGTILITESYEGLEGLHILVSGGDVTLTASDDGLNAAGGTDGSGMTGGRDGMFGPGMPQSSNGSITISGGTVRVTASGDGLDANGTLDITGGSITVCGPNMGDTATLDYDTRATISGGTFIGTGASGMAQTFSDSEQGVIAVRINSQTAGTEISLTDGKGTPILAYTAPLDFSVVILSSPDIIKGETYTITVGSASGEFTAS